MKETFILWLRRSFLAKWFRISKHKVPKKVIAKLYKNKYVTDRKREYKKEVFFFRKKYFEFDGMCHDTGQELFITKFKKRKRVKYYYRKLR